MFRGEEDAFTFWICRAYVDVGNIAYLWFSEKQWWKGEV